MRRLFQSSAFVNHVAGRVKQGERALKIQETDSDDDDGETWTAWLSVPQGFRDSMSSGRKSLAARSDIKRRAHYSFRIRLINGRGSFRIALWFLSPERVCLSSSITFPYLSGLDFYLQWAHFLFHSQTYSSVRCTAWIRRLKWKVSIGCKLSQQPDCCSNKQAFQLIGIDHWMSEKCSQ